MATNRRLHELDAIPHPNSNARSHRFFKSLRKRWTDMRSGDPPHCPAREAVRVMSISGLEPLGPSRDLPDGFFIWGGVACARFYMAIQRPALLDFGYRRPDHRLAGFY